MIPESYSPLLIWIAIGIIAAPLLKLVNVLLSPNYPVRPESRTTYECGEKPIGTARISFHPQFYVFAVIFVVFDVLSVFLLSWARVFISLSAPLYSLLVIGIFVATLLFGLFFWMAKGVVVWS